MLDRLIRIDQQNGSDEGNGMVLAMLLLCTMTAACFVESTAAFSNAIHQALEPVKANGTF